jgi:Uma2 family endonuclease
VDLLVEVADSSLRFDLTVKAALYARAEVCEYWVLDVSNRRLIAHRNPALGRYGTVVSYGETEAVLPLRATNSAPIPVGLMLPPSKA